MKNKLAKIGISLFVILILWGTYIIIRPAPKSIDDLMQSYVNPGIKIKIRSPFSGAVLVAKNDSIIFNEAYDLANREREFSNTTETKFGIGSVTKQFTAMLVMQQVQNETLNLSDTIGKFLPFLPSKMKDHITIHQLLSNTSGLPHYAGLESVGIRLSEFAKTSFTPKELAALIGSTNLSNKPGEAFEYSSLGYDLLGCILEEVTGKTFGNLLQENIISPLGLKNTGYASNEFVKEELATGYQYKEVYGLDWFGSEHGGEISEAPFRDQSNAFSAGGMYSTVEDLFTWTQAVKEHKILTPNLTELMLTPNKKGYCYGWVRNWDDIIEKNTSVQLYGHGGALFGNSAFVGMYDDGTTIIYLANINNLKAEEILHQIHLRANNLDLNQTYRLTGYPDRSSYEKFIAAGGMSALDDYFQRLSKFSGYKVNPSNSTIRGVMKIHLEAGKIKIADSLKSVFINSYKPDETTLNQFGYDFLYGDYPDYALEFFVLNTEQNPHSPNTWDSLGEAYLIYSNYQKSIDCYTKAVELAKTLNHPSLEVYIENLENAKKNHSEL